MKLIITGGHLTPALALIEHIGMKHPDWEIVFVGRKNALVGDSTISEEYRIIKDRNIPFIGLPAGRIRRFLSIGTIISLFMIPVGFFRALAIVLKERPDCIISFGGYIGLPVVVAGWILGIPSVIHEQAAVPGLSNRIASIFARRVCVSSERGLSQFPKKKTILTGLPLRQIIFDPPKKFSVSIPGGRKILYITGGATGSRSINELFYPIIGKLVGKYIIIHQVGRAWMSQAKKIRQGIRGDKRKNYIVQAYFDQEDHAWLLHHASLLIGRAGANIVAEIDIVGTQALLIPLPWSAGNEQYENAQILVRKQKALCLDQETLNPDSLLQNILSITDGNKFVRHEGYPSKRNANAAEKMYSMIAEIQS